MVCGKESAYTNTISARYYKDGSEVLIAQRGKNPRKISPREAARLQGFPDEFVLSPSKVQSYKQFGNAVVPQVVEEVGLKVIEVMAKHILMNNKSTLFKT